MIFPAGYEIIIAGIRMCSRREQVSSKHFKEPCLAGFFFIAEIWANEPKMEKKNLAHGKNTFPDLCYWRHHFIFHPGPFIISPHAPAAKP